MSNQRITSINVKQEDGTYKNYPLGTDMDNVIDQNNKTLTQVLQDNNNNFNLSIDGNELTLATPNGYTSTVTLPASGGQKKNNDVTFIDYDGTVLYSYTADEFLALSEMPQNPTHEGLESQGWNWSFEDAQAYVNNYGILNIGQMYMTDDGKTRIYISIPEGAQGDQLTFDIRYAQTASNGVIINWGDGTDPQSDDIITDAKTRSHTYAQGGNYIITLEVPYGTISFAPGSSQSIFGNWGSSYYKRTYIKKIELGDYITSISGAFYYCQGLMFITIPSLDYITTISSNTFGNCISLKSITIPCSIVNGPTFRSLSSLLFLSLPYSVTNIDQYFCSACDSLSLITLPPSSSSITKNAFLNSSCLSSIIIPSNITNIGDYAFSGCTCLSLITIPQNVTNIGNYAFKDCYGIGAIHLLSQTPPTLSHSLTFDGTYCIFYVPYSEDHSILEAYKSATNWSSYASRMQEEPQS